MSTIIDRFKGALDAEKTHTEFTPPAQKPEIVVTKTVTEQEDIKSIVIRQNENIKPTQGFTLTAIANEIGYILETAMHKAGVSSVSTEQFGLLNDLGITPKSFKRHLDQYTGREFFILKNANRTTEVFSPIFKALNVSDSDIVSFPYLVKLSIQLPMRYAVNSGDFENKEISVTSLFLTPKEIDSFNYAFVKTISFRERDKSEPNSQQLISIEIDRKLWQQAPYKV